MFDLEQCLQDQLRARMTTRLTLIFPEGDDARVIEAASHLVNFANVVLVAARERVNALIDGGEARLACSRRRFFAQVRCVRPSESPVSDRLAEALQEQSAGSKWEVSLERARQMITDPVYFAIMAVREGFADAVLGGLRLSSRDFFVPCLRLLERSGTVYEMALFALPDEHPSGIYQHNLVMFADVALNPVPTPEALADIAVGASRTMRDLIPTDLLPEVNAALLSYSTRGSGQGPSVERVRAAEPLVAERLNALREEDPLYESINIVTEMQISVALSETAARTKLGERYEHLRGAGRASLLVVPNLDVGNLLYHIYSTRYPNADSTLIIGGLRDQALDFSRSSTVAEIVRGAEALLLRRFRSDPGVRTRDDHFFPRYRVLTVNPGSTSTKVALWEGEDLVARSDVGHGAEALASCDTLLEQLPMRRLVVDRFLAKVGCAVKDLHAVVGRGGLMRPVESGTFLVDNAMVADLANAVSGSHPSNLGAIIARDIAAAAGVAAYTVDPPVVDELDDLSRITGYRESEQEAAWHALSQKAAAKHFGELHNRDYESMNLIVAHLGGGISVGSHRRGRCVRVKNALYDGPMSPNRAGTLPGLDLITLCYSGVEREVLERQLIGQGGLVSYLGTADVREVEKRIAGGDSRAAQVFEAMIEQIACEIASHVPKFKGEPIDQIILTGGLCHSSTICERLRRDLAALGIAITIYPGEREMEALRDGALRVLRRLEEAEAYRPLRDQL